MGYIAKQESYRSGVGSLFSVMVWSFFSIFPPRKRFPGENQNLLNSVRNNGCLNQLQCLKTFELCFPESPVKYYLELLVLECI